MKKFSINVLVLLVFSFLFSFYFASHADASKLKINYNNYTRIYKGKQINAYLDDKKINLNSTKGIFIKSNLMISYKDVFKNACGAKTTYNSSTKKLTISANGNTVKLKVGSKTAYVNGKKKKLEQAPTKVKYVKKKTSKILVPARFVAQSLGYSFRYDKDLCRINLTTPFVIKYDSKWHVYKKYIGGIEFNNNSIDTSTNSLLSINGCTMIPAKYFYSEIMGLNYSYDSSTGIITIGNEYNTIKLTIGSTNATVNDISSIVLKTPPIVVKRKDTGVSSVMVPASAVTYALQYYYLWDSTLHIATIHTKTYFNWQANTTLFDQNIYSNSVTNFRGDYDLNNKNLVFSSCFTNAITNDNVIVNEDTINNTLSFSITSTSNLVGEQASAINSQNINSVQINQLQNNSTNILFSLSDKISYYFAVTGNYLNIYISEECSADYSLRISKPDGVPFTSVTTTDLYYENKFIICLPGNQLEFYNAHPIICNSIKISGTTISLNTAGNTEITVNTTSLQGYKIVNLGTVIGVSVDDPVKIYDNIVVLDAGHGGKDPGAQSNSTNESDLNKIILYDNAKKYFDSPDSPVKAYWTRTDDTFISLDDRAKFASKVGADMFVSLHMNSSVNSSAKGTEVYYSNYNNNLNSFGLSSYRLAAKCIDNIIPSIGTSSRGIKSANYYVIKNNTVPAVLIELGFMSNSFDYNIITNFSKQDLAARAIYTAVVSAFSN